MNTGVVVSNSTGATNPYVGGLVGQMTNSKQMTLSRCFNIGKVYYNENKATTGYGSIVGCVDSGVTVNIPTKVYALSTSCSSIGTDNTGGTVLKTKTDSVAVYAAKGINATTYLAELFKDNSNWVTVTDSYPALAYFSNSTGAKDIAKSRLQTAIETANIDGTSKVRATSVREEFSFENSFEGDNVFQGTCVAGDYYYFAEYQGDDTGVCIKKVDSMSGEVVKNSELLQLYHANDMTYNGQYLVVCHGKGDTKTLSFVNPDTLEIVATKTFDFGIIAIDYNSKQNCYAVQVESSHYLYIMNANFEVIAKYEEAKYCNPKTYENYSDPQGMGSDDKHIYCLYNASNSSDANEYNNVIVVFDWDGNYITDIGFSLTGLTEKGENATWPQTIMTIGSDIYVSATRDSKLYKLSFE